MKKFKILNTIIFCTFIIFLSSCASANKNEIALKKLTKDQTSILDFIKTPNIDIHLFSYTIKDDYKKFDIWVDIYKNGELLDGSTKIVSMYSETSIQKTADVSMTIERTPDFIYSFNIEDGGAKTFTLGESQKNYLPYGATAAGPRATKAIIEDGKEIILYSQAFVDGNEIKTYEEDEFIKNPDTLKNYAYVHLVKCKFTK